MLGTIIKYDRIRGFGFVLPDDPTMPDFFVVPKFLTPETRPKVLMAGWRVDFEPFDAYGDKPQARNVRIVARPIARQTSAPVTGGAK